MLFPLRFRTFLVPVDDRLIRDHVGIVEYLDELREGLDDAGIRVAVYLNGVDQTDLGFGAVTESFEDGCVCLI